LRSSIAVSPSAARSRAVRGRAPSRVDLAGPDQVDQFGQEPVHRRWAPVQVDAGEEQLLAGNVDVVEATDEADVSTGSGRSAGAVCA
jgi:hypothetical protein